MLYLKAWYNLGLVRDPFLLFRAQLPIWDTTCAARITMAPSDRQDKKPKDTSPWLWTAPRNSVYLHCLHLHSCCSLACTPLTSTETRPGLLFFIFYFFLLPRALALRSDRVAELPSLLDKNWHKCQRHSFTYEFLNCVIVPGLVQLEFDLKETSQSSLKSNHRQAIIYHRLLSVLFIILITRTGTHVIFLFACGGFL